MSVAIRTATRIQDQDDFGSTPGAGNDGYALTWDNDAGEFVLAAAGGGVTDHGALTGLSDDDHTQYLLATGTRTGASSQAQTFTNGVVTAVIKPASDSAAAVQIKNAAGTATTLNVDTTNRRLGINTASPATSLHIVNPGKQAVVRLQGADWDQTASSIEHYVTYSTGGWGEFGINTSFSPNRSWFFGTPYNKSMLQFVVGYYAGTIGSGTSSPAHPDNSLFRILNTGYVGIGLDITPTTLLHSRLTSVVTNAVANVVTIGHDTSGTAAAGFGAGLAFQLESSTTAAQNAARIQALWYEATHATFKGDLVGTAYDAGGEREGWRVRGAGSAAAIGFLGATPAARIAHVADPAGGGTVDAEARTAINSILATLETFGFHATS